MKGLDRDLEQQRLLREAARNILKDDIRIIRGDLAERGIGARISRRIGTGATSAKEKALDIAGDRPWIVSGIVVAGVLWFARQPLVSAATSLFSRHSKDSDVEPLDAEARSVRDSSD